MSRIIATRRKAADLSGIAVTGTDTGPSRQGQLA
jgi:hypothetical protein